MSFLNILPRRTPKPAPGRHTAASIARLPMPGTPTGDMHIVTPGTGQPVTTGTSRAWRETIPEPVAATRLAETATWDKPDDLLMNEQDKYAPPARPYVPAPPSAYLRSVSRDGRQDRYPLGLAPVFAGTAATPDGRPMAGMHVGTNDGRRITLDVTSAAWAEDAITALTAIRDALTSDEAAEGGEAA